MTKQPIIQPVFESTRFELRDGIARLIGIPAISVLMHLIFHHQEVDGMKINPLIGLFVSFIYTIVYWEGIRLIWLGLVRKYNHYAQTWTRLTVVFFSILLYGVVATIFIQNASALLLGYACTAQMMVFGYAIGLIPTLVVVFFYETVYFFVSWKKKVQESEAISRIHLQSQLEALKNQLDPHFLFNSLNTLSSLIDENEPAQQYLNRLADVYRYVLLSKDRNTVTLREEMDFANAFLYLVKVRFRQGLEIHTEIPPTALDQMVAPLSVQLLLENALKHNVVTRENPLHIYIEVKEGYLRVKNEINPKVHFESGTKVGLNNILERYKLLTERPVQVLKDAVHFEVAIPLMTSST